MHELSCFRNKFVQPFFFVSAELSSVIVSPELSSVRDYVITHSVRSMCMYVVFCKIDHCIHIHWCIVMGLGHNDPWVESHMWPQQTWGQRSSRGQWPLVQVFGKKGQCIHILWCIFKSNILQWMQKNVIAKAGKTRGSRTALVFFFFFFAWGTGLVVTWWRLYQIFLWVLFCLQLYYFSQKITYIIMIGWKPAITLTHWQSAR